MKVVRYNSTPRFADIVVSLRALKIPQMTFRPKIKLHGANAAIVYDGKDTFTQNRSEVMTQGHNLFEMHNKLRLPEIAAGNLPFKIYGEWCGPGCAKHPDVISQIPDKSFFPFLLVLPTGEDASNLKETPAVYITDPEAIQLFLNVIYKDDVPENFHVLPYAGEEITIYAYDAERNKETHDAILAQVEEISKEDPYVKATFGISGRGEGLVFQQVDTPPDGKMPMVFKVKSEHHDVVKRAHVRSEIVIPENVQAFVEAFVTENRVRQMADENTDGEISMKVLGKLIPAVMRDIIKEGENEMTAGGIDAKMLGKVAPETIRKLVFRISNQI